MLDHVNVAVHDGATYQFSSKSNKEIFEANPEKYVPAYNGYCAFGVSVGKKFIGDPEVWRVKHTSKTMGPHDWAAEEVVAVKSLLNGIENQDGSTAIAAASPVELNLHHDRPGGLVLVVLVDRMDRVLPDELRMQNFSIVRRCRT